MTSTVNVHLECLQSLSNANIRYAVLHGWERIASGYVSDIDVIISPANFAKLEEVLRQHYRILNVMQYEASSYGFVLQRCGCDRSCIVALDVSLDYRWRGRIFFTADALLENRSVWCGIWTCGPAQEFMYLLTKKIYEKGIIPEHQRIRLRQLADDLGTAGRAMTTRLFGVASGSWLYDRIVSNDWTAIESQVPALRRSLKWCVLKYDCVNSIRYWMADLHRRWKRWRYPTGVAIAVASADVTYTATLMEHLQRVFAKAFRRSVVVRAPSGSNLFQQLIFQSQIRMLTRRSALVAVCAPAAMASLIREPAITVISGAQPVQVAEDVAAYLTRRYLERRQCLLPAHPI